MSEIPKSKLQRQYDEINDPNSKTLEEQEKVQVQKYQMKEGDYKILITIYQAQELQPKKAEFLVFSMDKTACDAFVEVEIRGEKRKTAIRPQTNNPIWQESFYYHFENLTVQDLDNSKIIFNVYDKNNIFLKNSHVGQIQLDWTNIYFRRHHEIYRGWLTLSDPGEENKGAMGYLLVNIAVLGPEDKVMVHDTAFIKDPLTTIEDTITNTKIKLIDYSITVQVYRGENLIPLDLAARSVDAYVIAKFSGNKIETKYVKKTLNPQWNQALKIATGVPTKTRYLTLQVWNHNYFSKDDLIGTLRIPFVDICEHKYTEPQWGHLYGPPMCAVDQPPSNYASKMQLYGQELGSHYRGRILFKIVGKRYVHSTTGKTDIKFKFPYKPTPVVALKTYTLSLELIEGFQLPRRNQAFIQVAMGQYVIKTSRNYQVQQKRLCQFHDILQDKKVQFPEDIQQVPDIIIYFCDGPQEKNRMTFVRIKASDVKTLLRNKQSKILPLQGDKSLHLLKNFEIGGYLNCRVNLYTDAAPAVKTIESELIDKTSYYLSLYIFKGEDFPPAKIEGSCSPVIKFNCFGSTAASKVKERSFNPIWGQDLHMSPVSMQDIFATNITKAIVCQVFDHVDGESKDQFIGSFIIQLQCNQKSKQIFKPEKKSEPLVKSSMGTNANQQPIEYLYLKPRWYYVINPHIEVGKNIFGRVLMGAALFKFEDIQKQRIPALFYNYSMRPKREEQKKEKGKQGQLKLGEIDQKKSVKAGAKSQEQEKYKRQLIEYQTRSMQIYVIGLRQIRDSSKTVLTQGHVDLLVSIGESEFWMPKNVLKRSGCEINKLIQLQVKIPKNKYLVPFMDFSVKFNGNFYGYNSSNLYKLLPKLKQKEGENTNNSNNVDDSQDTILDVEGLQKQLQMLREKKKKDQKDKLDGKFYKQDDDQVGIKELKPPGQLVVFNKQQLNDNDPKFKELLDQFTKVLEDKDNVDYRYVKQLQEINQHANRRFSVRNDILPQQLNENADEFNQENLVQAENEEERLSKANPQPKGSNRQVSQSRSKGNSYTITQTVFEKRKKKLLLKSNLKTSVKKEDSKIKVQKQQQKSEQKIIKKQLQVKEPQIKGSKNRMIQEQHQREIKIDLESDASKNEKKLIQGDVNGNAEQKQRFVVYLNNEESLKKDYKDTQTRYDSVHERPQQKSKQQREEGGIAFQIKTQQQFSDYPVQERAVTYQEVERAIKQEEKDQKEALERDADYRFAQAVKLSLFGWKRKKRRKDYETYEDFDTEAGEDLNIIPQWYKGRKILTSDFQDLNFKSTKIQTIPLYGGKPLENTTIYQRYKQSAGHVKLICLSEPIQVARQKQEQYTKLLKPRQFYCRIYCLKGKSLIPHYQGKPTTYLKFSYGDKEYSFQKTKKVKEENNPQYYICQEIQINLPGPSVIKIQVMEEHHIFGKLNTRVLGFTEIDIEQRYFTRKWHLYEKKPIELRNLYSQFGIGTQGRLQTWIDLIQKKNWISTPAHKIHPPPFDEYELRVIVWKTDDCVYKNVEMESNDVFVRGVIGTGEPQQTDTHWACRTTGNFNYRFKFPVNYPPKPEDMYSDVFVVQIWDRDIIGFNNLIGETRVNLNKVHKIIQKAVKRRKTVKASMKIKEKNFAVTDRFWYDVYNHKQKDEFGIPQSQGRVQLSFQLVPKEEADNAKKNGYGRSEPNVYPTLPDPEGRLQFDFFSPLAFLKQILGPNLYRKCCCKLICCLLILLIAFFGYIFFPTLIAVKI